MFFSVVKKLFNKQIKHLEAIAASNAVASYREEQTENHRKMKRCEAEMWLDKPIIGLSNEWNEPIVGELIEIVEEKNGSFWFVYKNYLTNKESSTLFLPFAFSEQKLKTIGKMNPDEYCSLLYEGRSYFGEFRKHPNYGKTRENEFSGYENWVKKLKENGFYDRFGDFLKGEEEKAKIHLKELSDKYGDFYY